MKKFSKKRAEAILYHIWKYILPCLVENGLVGGLKGMYPLRSEEIFENVPFKLSDFVPCFEINIAILVENSRPIVVDK